MNCNLFYFGVLCLLVVSSESFLLHTNIGKFLHNVLGKAQNHTLSCSADLKVDRNVLEEAFQGFRNIIDDPLYINEQTLNYEMHDVVKCIQIPDFENRQNTGIRTELLVENLKNASLDHLYISKDTLYSEFVISIPKLQISGFYNSSCYLKQYDFDIYGNGTFKWLIAGFQMRANFTFKKMKTGYMQLDKVKWDQSIKSSKFEIKNLLNDEEFSNVVSEVLTVVIPPLHNYFKPVIDEFIIRLMLLYSEILFSNLTTKDFVCIIFAFKDQYNKNNVLPS